MNFFEYQRSRFLRYLNKNKPIINSFVGIGLVVATVFFVDATNGSSFDLFKLDNWWGKWGDPVIGFATFLVAVIIWFTNTAKNWKDNLKKKLTVIYKYNTKEVLRCEKAFLAHESDIRNWGQTIGRLIVGKDKTDRDYYFKFNRDLEMQPPSIEEANRQFYTHYIVTFFLTELPSPSQLQSGIDMSKGKFLWEDGADTFSFKEYVPKEEAITIISEQQLSTDE